MSYNSFGCILVESYPFINLGQERQLIFSEEVQDGTVIDDDIADCVRLCVNPSLYLIPSVDGVNVWSHPNHLARQTTGLPHVLHAVQSPLHLPRRCHHYVGIGVDDDMV